MAQYACLARPWFSLQQPQTQGVVARAENLCSQETKAGGSEVHIYPWPYCEFKASLADTRTCLQKKYSRPRKFGHESARFNSSQTENVCSHQPTYVTTRPRC